MNSISIPELNTLLVSSGVGNVLNHLMGDIVTTSGNSYQIGNTSGEKGNSLAIYASGEKAGNWKDFATGESGDLLELWMLNRGLSKAETIDQIKKFLALPFNNNGYKQLQPPILNKNLTSDKKQKLSKHLHGSKPSSTNALAKYRNRLAVNNKAKQWLFSRGFNQNTIDHFRLGLSLPYKDKNEIIRSNALIFPLINLAGEYCTPNAYYNIPDVTNSPISDNGWCSGKVRLSYNTTRKPSHHQLMIVEGFKDLWSVHQMIQGSDLEDRLLLATGSHGTNIPIEVEADPLFFDGFDTVYLAHDADEAGNALSLKWANFCNFKAYRTIPPLPDRGKKGSLKDWNDLLKLGGTSSDVANCIANSSRIYTNKVVKTPDSIDQYEAGNIYGYRPVDISGAFIKGYLYYPVIVHEVGTDPQTHTVAHAQVVKVVRSDKKVLDYRALPLLKRSGAIPAPLFVLGDGNIISGTPKVSASNTWDWASIEKWMDLKYSPRRIDEIVRDIESILKMRIWLPNPENYITLSLVVVASYVQSVFDAIPLILASGEKGTGKSEVGKVMSEIACNGKIIGASSAATLSRSLDEARGFVVLDDLEKISNKTKGAGATESDNMLQILKVSYKQSTASREVTDSKTMRVQKLNFFGIKFMTNTTGVEEILGSRCITIQTKKAPMGFKTKDVDDEDLLALRNELHCWAMDNVKAISDAYKAYKPTHSNRLAEITSPLRSIIDVSESPQWHKDIDSVVERIQSEQRNIDSPDEILREAVFSLASKGFESISFEHLILELKTLVPKNYMKQFTTEIPEWQTHTWIKRKLVSYGYIPPKNTKKFRANGVRSKQYGLYPLTEVFYEDFEISNEEGYQSMLGITKRSGEEFCKLESRCSGCPYDGLGCEVQKLTKKNEMDDRSLYR